MKVHRYLREVVEPYVLPYFNRPIDPIFFKQYNVLPVARVSLNFFEETHVNLVPWLARSFFYLLNMFSAQVEANYILISDLK